MMRIYIMGGVSGHAGLFSKEDISSYSKMMINQGYANGVRYFSKISLKDLQRKARLFKSISWVDTPSQNGKSSAGDYFLNLLMDIWVLLVHQCG